MPPSHILHIRVIAKMQHQREMIEMHRKYRKWEYTVVHRHMQYHYLSHMSVPLAGERVTPSPSGGRGQTVAHWSTKCSSLQVLLAHTQYIYIHECVSQMESCCSLLVYTQSDGIFIQFLTTLRMPPPPVQILEPG